MAERFSQGERVLLPNDAGLCTADLSDVAFRAWQGCHR
jgi:hypothetical protein